MYIAVLPHMDEFYRQLGVKVPPQEFESWFNAAEVVSANGGSIVTYFDTCDKWLYWNFDKPVWV